MNFFIYFLIGTLVPLSCWRLDARVREEYPRMSVFGSVLAGLVAGYIGWRHMPAEFTWNFWGNWLLLGLVGLIVLIPRICLYVSDLDGQSQLPEYRPVKSPLAWVSSGPILCAAIMLAGALAHSSEEQGSAEHEQIEGVIDGVVRIEDSFYLRFEGVGDREFLGTNDISPELKWAEPGMTATVLFQDGGSKTQQIYRFDLPGLELSELSSDDT